jgi:hypothetical protein
LKIAVVVVGKRLVAEGELAVVRVIAGRCERLGYAGSGPAATDLGPVAGFVVLVWPDRVPSLSLGGWPRLLAGTQTADNWGHEQLNLLHNLHYDLNGNENARDNTNHEKYAVKHFNISSYFQKFNLILSATNFSMPFFFALMKTTCFAVKMAECIRRYATANEHQNQRR